MGKKTTDTLVREKQEQRILQISFWSGAGFVIAEFIMTLYSHSQSVLTDTVFDAVELLIIALTMFIVPLFYRPVSEKHPFGYSQLESIFIQLKGFMVTIHSQPKPVKWKTKEIIFCLKANQRLSGRCDLSGC